MLFLLFYVGETRYACPGISILEVIPKVSLRAVPGSTDSLTGLLNVAGEPVPVVDLCQLIEARPCVDCMHTRIVLLQQNQEKNERVLGIIAEKITETIDYELSEFKSTGIKLDELPFVGGVIHDDRGVVYLLKTEKLFEVMQNLLSTVEE